MPTTIRASALNLARYCHGAHALAALHPRVAPALTDGETIDLAIKAVHEAALAVARDTAATTEGTRKHEALRLSLSGVLEVKTRGESWIRETSEWLLEIWPHLRTAQLERALEWELADGVTLTGHADACAEEDGGCVVFDWKTGGGHTLPPLDEDLQMIAYAVMWACTTTHKRVTVHRVQVDLRESSSLTLEGETLTLAEEAVCEVATAAALDPDTRTPGHHCGHCLTRRSCPEYLAAAEDLTCAMAPIRGQGLTSEAQAVRLLKSMQPVKDALEWADDALRAYVRAHGPLRSDGKEWGPKVIQKRVGVYTPTDQMRDEEQWRWRRSAK